jgi:hypothetical protein
VRVTVVIVLASTTDPYVDPKLADLARVVRKENGKYVGFRIGGSAQKSLPIGGEHTFDLIDGKPVRLMIMKPRGPDGLIGLRVHLPDGTWMKYDCVCSKFVPFYTSVRTCKGEHVIVAVMAKPCTGK